ncbi:alpha/beta fold hydrolase [Gordonia sp. ABSL49_1]|uniref:alpha/beta fold hydrolase n=1 Tax=Gordonia sp. ABSL49_1 TaxID=2920941 RepID=UPI001F0EF285|nr:alpha/beta hydrolase [Gordonia sp. ABSL49_1]MCH5645413.1 alpha/beta hydrolase [Gordonia sp. ABSL49_1]
MPTIELATATIEYETFGPEDSPHPPVVFVHGVVVDGRMWTDAAQSLADAGFRCYAPTFTLGAHHIPWGPDADRTPSGAARLIREFVDAQGLTSPTLVGCDTGGALCQFALDQDPDFAGRVVFTNCDAFEQFPPQPYPVVFALLTRPGLTKRLVGLLHRSTALRHSIAGFGLLVTDPDPELSASILDPLRSDERIRDDLAAFLRAIDSSELAAITPRLSKVAVPVSVVWGTADRAFRPKLGRRLASVFADATFTEVPRSRTFVAMDRPQAVVDAVVEISARQVPRRP